MKLYEKSCSPSSEGDQPYTQDEAEELMTELSPEWELFAEAKKLRREFKFKNFKSPMKLAMIIGDIAETENHHPDLIIRWGFLATIITTHDVGGLVESDFIFASKVDSAFNRFSELL